MNTIFCFFKRFILSSFIIYGYNLISVNFNLMIPINIFTIGIVTFLGSPGLFSLVIFKILML